MYIQTCTYFGIFILIIFFCYIIYLFLKNKLNIKKITIIDLLLIVFLTFESKNIFYHLWFGDYSINFNTIITSYFDSSLYSYSIFFFESNYMRNELSTKQMCAIESAAKTNPNALVQVHIYTAKLKDKEMMLKKYPNLKIIDFAPNKVFNNTPILKWWMSGAVFKSPYSFSHMTDAFR